MKILNLLLFVLLSNFCFSQKVKYGKFAFETIDSVYHRGGADTILRMVDGKMIVQALGLNPSKYERIRDTTFHFFNKNITLHESNLNYEPTQYLTFSDFKTNSVDYFIEKESGTTKRKFELKKTIPKHRNCDYQVIYYKDIRRNIAGFDCFKVELIDKNEPYDGKITLFVTDKIASPSNQIPQFKNLPPNLYPLYTETRNERRKTIVQAIKFEKKKYNLKKQRKLLLKNAKDFNMEDWIKSN